jgi:hypothetical protein
VKIARVNAQHLSLNARLDDASRARRNLVRPGCGEVTPLRVFEQHAAAGGSR